jgi:excisionase family DNA binding protein
MATSFLTNLNEEEFKAFLKESLTEILEEYFNKSHSKVPEILDIKQAAEFLKLQVTTLYEKTSQKTIPHFKKGNKLYFQRDELQGWLAQGKVKTAEELRGEAATYTLNKSSGRK